MAVWKFLESLFTSLVEAHILTETNSSSKSVRIKRRVADADLRRRHNPVHTLRDVEPHEQRVGTKLYKDA